MLESWACGLHMLGLAEVEELVVGGSGESHTCLKMDSRHEEVCEYVGEERLVLWSFVGFAPGGYTPPLAEHLTLSI